MCLDGQDPNRDSLCFHRDAWNGDDALLATADRIILCQDAREQNVAILGQIHRYFPVKGQLHLLCNNEIPGHTVFGTQDTVYTAQLVLRDRLSKAARIMHRIYRESTGSTAPAWEQLSEFLRQSNIAAAGHLLTKIRMLLQDDSIRAITPENCRAAFLRYRELNREQKEVCRQIEHLRWMRFHSMYNWRYAPVRNNAAREHPLMLGYGQLEKYQQEKDDYAWELLDQLAAALDK